MRTKRLPEARIVCERRHDGFYDVFGFDPQRNKKVNYKIKTSVKDVEKIIRQLLDVMQKNGIEVTVVKK